jgi:hypothetical protein
MSVDFTFAQVGPSQPLYELMVNIESHMEKIGFKKSGSVYKVELDERGVYDEIEEYVILGKKFSDSKDDLQNWKGLSVEFNSIEYTVYLLICNYNDQYLNSFIEISGNVINKLISEHEADNFMRLVSVIAMCINSQGGFGTFELPFEPVPPEKIVPYIFSNPEGVPSLLGLIPYGIADEVEVRNMASTEFKVRISTLGFYFLEHGDFNS